MGSNLKVNKQELIQTSDESASQRVVGVFVETSFVLVHTRYLAALKLHKGRLLRRR